MPRKNSPYNHRYEKERATLLGLPCEMRTVCDGAPANSADHEPPLSRHLHIEGSGCCRLRPACKACQGAQARHLAGQTARFKALGLPIPQPSGTEPSREWL